MKAITLFLTILLLTGCGGDKSGDEKKPEMPETTQTPPPSAEPTVPAEEPTPEATPATPPASKPVSKPAAKPAVSTGVTIIGEVIDIVSYSASGVLGSTPSGKEIIIASAQGGNPLGILEKKTGDVYLVTMKQANSQANTTLLPFIGIQIAAKGDVYRKGGQQLLVMNTIGKSIK